MLQPKLYSFFFFILAVVFCEGQNLNGIWRGKRTQENGGCYPEYTVELQIDFSNNIITGNAYHFYDRTRFVRLDFNGRYNAFTKRLMIIENKILNFQIPVDCVPCIKTYDLTYSSNGKEEFLKGDWKGFEIEHKSTCPPGAIVLQRMENTEFPVPVKQSDTLAKIQKTLKLQEREKTLVKTIKLDTSQIKIELYDDAEIDGDTVTVFLNNTLLLYRRMLTDKPLQLNINVFPGVEYELMMYADNLGLIPPNTALMVLTCGKKKYEIRLSSSEQKTAVVRFIYQPGQ